jgi:hypothetical protein
MALGLRTIRVMASRLEHGQVVEQELGEVRRYRVLTLDDEPRGRPPTAEEMAAGGMGAPPPRGWGLDKRWRPVRASSRQV